MQVPFLRQDSKEMPPEPREKSMKAGVQKKRKSVGACESGRVGQGARLQGEVSPWQREELGRPGSALHLLASGSHGAGEVGKLAPSLEPPQLCAFLICSPHIL